MINTLTLLARLAQATPIENQIIATLADFPKKGVVWTKCSEYEDVTLKRDAFAIINNKKVYIQIKFRQTGSDILFCVLQPYPGLSTVKQMVKDKTINSIFARDYKSSIDYYACLINEKLFILPYKDIKKKVFDIFVEWLMSGVELNEANRTFRSGEAELKWKRDSGINSFDSGVEKIICFLPISLFEEIFCIPF